MTKTEFLFIDANVADKQIQLNNGTYHANSASN
jgi:hypothetical protein